MMRPFRRFLIGILGPLMLCSCFVSAADGTECTPALAGICITSLPDPALGSVMLGPRTLQAGDVLTAAQWEETIFLPVSPENPTAQVCFLPIYSHGVAQEAAVTLSRRGKADLPPAAEDMEIETYKNLPAEGLLKVEDPEQQPMVFSVARNPRRGSLILREDGSYLYSPDKNKVGTDSFSYTATDPAGNISREATVVIHILKPSDNLVYKDTAGLPCRFEAEWLRHRGVFSGEQIGGQLCFSPNESVSRGQFLAMLLDTLEFPLERVSQESDGTVPSWLSPYVTAGIRAGILPADQDFRWDQLLTGGEAAEMVHRALTFSVPTMYTAEGAVSSWQEKAAPSAQEAPFLRSDAALVLYRLHRFRMEAVAEHFSLWGF